MTFLLCDVEAESGAGPGPVRVHVATHAQPQKGEIISFRGTEYEVVAVVHNAVIAEDRGAFEVPTVRVRKLARA